MSLLTRIYNLKSKYRETAGFMNEERATIQDLTMKQGKAQKQYSTFSKGDFATAQTAYKGAGDDFVKAYGTQSEIDSFQLGESDIGQIGENYRQRQITEFNKTGGARDFYNWQGYIQSGGGPQINLVYDRARAGIADYKRMVTDPMDALTASAENLSSKAEGFTAASDQLQSYQESYKSYGDQIGKASERLQGYGASQIEIQDMIAGAQRQYGFSTEQRKRGTRSSSQRRTALTSRSGYA